MPKPFVSIGCSVMLSPGMAGPPDTGTIMQIPQTSVTAGGMPLAVANSICLMINSVTGAPYNLPIGTLGSAGVKVNGMSFIRMGDIIPTPPGVMTILGPPASPAVTDSWAP